MGEEGIAGQERGRFVKSLVHGRPAAPQIVVVHAGKVVMDKRVGVEAFDRDRGRQGIGGAD